MPESTRQLSLAGAGRPSGQQILVALDLNCRFVGAWNRPRSRLRTEPPRRPPFGVFIQGTVPFALGQTHECPGHVPAAQKAWSAATASFALVQAAAVHGLSFLSVHSGAAHHVLFGLGAAALRLALLVDLLVPAVAGNNEADGAV